MHMLVVLLPELCSLVQLGLHLGEGVAVPHVWRHQRSPYTLYSDLLTGKRKQGCPDHR